MYNTQHTQPSQSSLSHSLIRHRLSTVAAPNGANAIILFICHKHTMHRRCFSTKAGVVCLCDTYRWPISIRSSRESTRNGRNELCKIVPAAATEGDCSVWYIYIYLVGVLYMHQCDATRDESSKLYFETLLGLIEVIWYVIMLFFKAMLEN